MGSLRECEDHTELIHGFIDVFLLEEALYLPAQQVCSLSSWRHFSESHSSATYTDINTHKHTSEHTDAHTYMTHTYVFTYKHVYTQMHIETHMHAEKHIWISMQMHTHAHTDLHMSAHICVYIYVHTCPHIHIQKHIGLYPCTCMHKILMPTSLMYRLKHVHTQTHTVVHIYVDTGMPTDTWTLTKCTYRHILVSIHAHTHLSYIFYFFHSISNS